MLVPEYVEKDPYLGILFILGGIAATYVGFRLWQQADPATWLAGAVVAGGMAAGFLISRIFGLPGLEDTDWEPTGIVATGAGLTYLTLWLRHKKERDRSSARSAHRRMAVGRSDEPWS